MRSLGPLVAFLALAACGCGTPRPPDPGASSGTTGATGTRAGSRPSPTSDPDARARAIAWLSTWPGFDFGEAPPAASGTTRTELHHGTIHATIDLPAGAGVEYGALEFGHPVVRVREGGVVVELTFGVPPRYVALGQLPPGRRTGRIEADAGNVTYRDGSQGTSTVLGHAPGVRCEARAVPDGLVDRAFSLCRSVRAAPLSALVERADLPAFAPPLPAHATAESVRGDLVVHTGRVRLQVGPRPCRDRAFYEAHAFDSTFETRPGPHGEVLVERLYSQEPPNRWASSVVVRENLSEGCCMAQSIEFREPPDDAAIGTMIGLCALSFGRSFEPPLPSR